MARPLSKMKDGVPYTRPPGVEAAIDEALTQSLDTVSRRAAIRNPSDPEYMPPECLRHLAREARLKRDKAAEGRLLAALLTRCEARLGKAIPDGGRADASGLREEILQELGTLFARVGTNHDSTQLDYFEIHFNQAFRAMRIDHLRKQSRREKHFRDIGEEKDEDGGVLDEENALARWSAVACNPAQHLYARLGFRVVGDDGARLTMRASSRREPISVARPAARANA